MYCMPPPCPVLPHPFASLCRTPPPCRHTNAFITNLNGQVLTKCPDLNGKSVLELVLAVGAKCSWNERRVSRDRRAGWLGLGQGPSCCDQEWFHPASSGCKVEQQRRASIAPLSYSTVGMPRRRWVVPARCRRLARCWAAMRGCAPPFVRTACYTSQPANLISTSLPPTQPSPSGLERSQL